jgi:hypothetical protein
MPDGKKRPTPSGPYDIAEIAARIERRRRQLKIPAKQLATRLGLYASAWSKKVHCRGSTFTVNEISALAPLLGAETGWPFLDEHLGAFLDRHLDREDCRHGAGTSPASPPPLRVPIAMGSPNRRTSPLGAGRRRSRADRGRLL